MPSATLDGWPVVAQMKAWKECLCGNPLYGTSRSSLPEDFRSLWPANGGRFFIVHATRELTEKCQIAVVHYPDFPFVCHFYGEVMFMEERSRIIHELYARVKMSALDPMGKCNVCQEPWFKVHDPQTGLVVTCHQGLAQERRCALTARIARGAKM